MYTGYQETLRELYANLIASSMDAQTAREAHPSFVEMIRQITPDEALIMRLLSNDLAQPFLDLRAEEVESSAGDCVFRYYSFIPEEAGCSFIDLGPTYLLNLHRLGLIELREAYRLLRCENEYDKMREVPYIRTIGDRISEEPGKRVITIEGAVILTDLGRKFCFACITEGTHE